MLQGILPCQIWLQGDEIWLACYNVTSISCSNILRIQECNKKSVTKEKCYKGILDIGQIWLQGDEIWLACYIVASAQTF